MMEEHWAGLSAEFPPPLCRPRHGPGRGCAFLFAEIEWRSEDQTRETKQAMPQVLPLESSGKSKSLDAHIPS